MTNPSFAKKRSIIAWCLYDWANSAFPTIVLTFIFAAYFTEKVAVNKIIGTAQWGTAMALGGLCIALVSPILGAIADYEGRRKPWILILAVLIVGSAALLWFAKPSVAYVHWTLFWVVIGIIGVEIGQVFYNAMLYDLAPKNYIGRISGWGWGCGYFGGLCSLTLALLVFVYDHVSWLDKTTFENIRICGPLVSVWFIVFSLPFFLWTTDRPSTGLSYGVAVKKGLKQLLHTLKTLPQHKQILKFLIARMIYIDGLNTVFAFGGIYAAGTFDMTFAQIVQFGIAMNVAAGLGAIGFAWLDDWIGSKITILIALVFMLICGIGMLIATDQTEFWILGMGLSLCVGPIQAASRSLMIHLVPAHLMTEMFGLYAFSGKATAFIGPWFVGTFTLLFNSQRIGMSTIMFFLATGAVLLMTVRWKRPEK